MRKQTANQKSRNHKVVWIVILTMALLLTACGKGKEASAENEAHTQSEQEAGSDKADVDAADPADGASGAESAGEEDRDAFGAESAGEEDRDASGAESAGEEDGDALGGGHPQDASDTEAEQSGQDGESGTVQNGRDSENGNAQNEDSQGAEGAQNVETAQGSDASAAPRPHAEGETPYGAHGALSVNGTKLVDTYGAPYQLRGVSTHGLSWFPQYANQAAFRTMRDEWGVNVVRLAMYTAEYGGYCVGDENNRNNLKKLVYDSVDAATELGMYVIVDWHILNDRDPNTYIDQAIAFFRETAARYAAYGNVIYEICNEPNGGVSWQRIKTYAEQVIPVIREQDADAVIIVGTPTWSQDVDQAAADPITGYGNIMYTLHFYADTHRDSLRGKMENAIAAGLPVFVTEFGICDASGSGAINTAEADKWIRTLDENNVSYCIWNLSNKSETSALLRTSTTATSGWAYDELSESGKWFVNMMGADHSAFGSSGNGSASNAGNGNSGSGGGSASNGGNSGNGNGGSGSNGSGTPSDTNNGSSGNSSPQNVTSDTSGALQATVSLSSSWESNGKHCYQYTLEMTNTSGAAVNGWTCEISFNGNMSVSQLWCGSFSVNGSRLTITPESYNAAIEAGAAQGNIGFILESDAALTVEGFHVGRRPF